MSSGEKGAVMRLVGMHIEAKRGRGRLRDGGASKENMFFSRLRVQGVGGFKVLILWESFWFLKYTRGGGLRYFFRAKGVQALVARKEQIVRA